MAAVAAFAACGAPPGGDRPTAADSAAEGLPLFESLPASRTGMAFVNTLPEAPEFSILNYLYYYNGGGVAVGDVDGDGRQDVYLSSNLESNRLYRNRGDFTFEDITARAGVAGPPGWKTGVSMADVNGDGALDLYVSAVNYLTMAGRNVLYINDGTGVFTDRTDAYGLAFSGFSTHSLFFDYDRDGDLDLYLLNHSVHTERQIGVAARRDQRHPQAGDRLYRNDGARFTDVSAAAGIFGGVEGFGLGVVASDVNLDGCLDVYVANDFQENDFLYLNDCRGRFTEVGTQAFSHTSRFSMGADAADMNDDGRPDIMTVDMLPEQESIFKTSASYEGWNLFDMRLRAGYSVQYPRNALQLNRGDGTFAEVALLAGVAASDWSWGPLFADLDNDGRKDLFITNGIYRRPNDLDYINYVGNEAAQAALARGVTRAENRELLQRMPQIPLANHAYRNDGDLRFTDMAERWGLGEKGFSNGSAYVDLDDDGALDLIINRINAPVAVYRNTARANGNTTHWLQVRLAGSGRNTDGIGAKITAVTGAHRQLLEQQPVRGFQSSVDRRLHFGLGASAVVDSLIVVWPDARYEIRTNVAADRSITLHQDSSAGQWRYAPIRLQRTADDAPAVDAAVPHLENDFLDYNREPLMPHVVSAEGPALAVGDVNGDGRDDLYVGGAKWQRGTLLLQQRTGRFAESSAATFAVDSTAEDVDATFFDADGDGDLDLYVVSAGNEFWSEFAELDDRLYLNDGRGAFTRAVNALPAGVRENGSTVTAADFDGDGDQDLFVGSRVVAREYGRTPTSHLLRNNGAGQFTDVTESVAPGLARAGLVTSAQWADVNGDARPDLVVVGEWMPVRIWINRGDRLEEQAAAGGLAAASGWWNSLSVADLNGDGAPDLVLGNAGTNGVLRASAREPVRMYVHDFTGTGSTKQIITRFVQGVAYPLAGRDELVKLMPAIRGKYPTFAAFGASRLEEIFDPAEIAKAEVKEATTFESAVAINDGRGRFTLRPLPVAAQLSMTFATLITDANGDGHQDIFLAGNAYGVPPVIGRYDASRGVLLHGDGAGGFRPAEATVSPTIDGQVRALAPVRRAGKPPWMAVARNGAPLQLLTFPRSFLQTHAQ
ncbi:MAG: FG-GAP-like repeat-containing protein [Gemmatimonas sp.]